jgi:hypothetical protein
MQSLHYRIFIALINFSIIVCDIKGIAIVCGSLTLAGVEQYFVNGKFISRVAIG